MTKPLPLAVAFIGVAVAGVIIGYALFGMEAASLRAATATAVTTPPPRLIETLPDCRDLNVRPGALCAPLQDSFAYCMEADFVPKRIYAVPCRKPSDL
jgi:hypothetical protein